MLDVAETVIGNDRNDSNSHFWISGLSAGYSLKEYETNNNRQKNTIKLEKRSKLLFTISLNVDQDF